jgi:PAS domain-containing protein
LPEKLREEKDDYVTIVQNSNLISDYMHDASEFALKIGDGNFEYEFTPKSSNDKLGNALIQMRNRLQQVANEDRIRNWVNEGQAKFGEILRETSNDIHEMGDALISNLVNYVGASMGAIYIKNEGHGETKMELLSAFAFNRKKHEERVLNPGEGLAGQVFIEKKSVFIKDLQNDHFNISTGMGESRPASVLIVPLKDENDVEGVLELASFNAIEQYQIDFVEKLGESIASAIKSGKTNSVTKHLLEEMQTREEQMKTQEEELKQNMEELSATQEQMERLRKEDEVRKTELESKRRTLYNVLDNLESKVYLKDANGRYQYINAKYAEFVGQTIESIIGTTDDELLGSEISAKRSNWEKTVLKTANTITEEEELNGEKHSLTLSFIEIAHLNGKGILGELK